MNLFKFSSRFIALLAAFSLLLGACAKEAAPTATPEPITLRLAVLPILDTLPMYVAQQEGLYAKHGIQVELIPAASAAERDQLINAGQADGMINEVVSTLLYNKDSIQVQIVRYARAATAEEAMFRILAASNSGITSVEGLKGVEIGISQGTVIQYITDRLLEAEGLSRAEIQFIAVPKIPDRMALLGTGELKAATLPEPLSSLAMQQGAVLILDDTKHPELSYSTYAFRKGLIDQSPAAIKAFLAAIEEAVALINANPAKYATLLVEQKLVPAPLAGSFPTPAFITKGVPTQAQWDDTMAWAKANGLIKADVSYADSVTSAYLP